MQSPGLPRLDIDVRDRRTERCLAIAGCVLALLVPWLMVPEAVSPTLALFSGLCVAALLAIGFYKAGWWAGGRRIERVIWDRDGYWRLLDASGQAREAQLADGTRIGPGYVWLQWHTAQPRCMFLLPCDVPADQLRYLAVRLRIDRSSTASLPHGVPL